MSAGSLGSTLLQEVKVEGLNELLRTLRSAHETPQDHTGFPVVDKLFAAFQQPVIPRSGHNLSSNAAPTLSSNQGTVVRSQQLPVLELAGASPCSGKTQLLYYLVSLSLLPPEYEGIDLGGKSSAVILCDLGHNFSVLRLLSIMKSHVQSRIDASAELKPMETFNTLIQSSLDHLHVFRPHSSSALLATLSNLQSYVFDTASHYSANRCVGFIILHDLDSFLWQDRLEDAEDETSDGKPSQKITGLSRHFRDMVAHLRHLQADFSCLVIATSSALSAVTYTRINGLAVPSLRSHLPNVWRNFVTLRLIVQRDTIRKFPLGISAEEAAREAHQRREAVEKCMFSARMDWSESDNWREGTMSAIKALGDGGEFVFKVTTSGVSLSVEC